MRPRTLGKIVVAVMAVICLLVALIYASEDPNTEAIYKSLRALTYAIMGLALVTAYRYFED